MEGGKEEGRGKLCRGGGKKKEGHSGDGGMDRVRKEEREGRGEESRGERGEEGEREGGGKGGEMGGEKERGKGWGWERERERKGGSKEGRKGTRGEKR